MRHASVVVCDDLTYSLNGKMNAVGIYTGDIIIPASPAMLNQLIFLFIIETEPSDPFKSLILHVSLPNGQSHQIPVVMETLVPAISDQTRWTLRWPLAFYGPFLTPGPIVAKILHEGGEIIAAAPIITIASPHIPSPVTTEKMV